MADVTSARYDNIQARIANILGNGAGTSGYGQTGASGYGSNISSYSVSGIQNKTIEAADINAIYVDMVRARAHQTGVETSQIAQMVADLNVIAENESYFVNNDGTTTIDTAGAVKGIVDFESLITQIETDKFTVHDSQKSLESKISSSRTTPWNGVIFHEFTITFIDANHRRHFFNSGGDIRISGNNTGALTPKGTDWNTLLTSIGTIIFNYDVTRSSVDAGSPSNIGNYDLTSTYQTIYSKAGSGSSALYAGNIYTIQAREVSSNVIQFKIIFNDNSTGTTIDNNVDGTILSSIQHNRATGNYVQVPTPTYTNDITLSSFSDPAPQYTLSSTASSVFEGESFTINLNTFNVANNTLVPYTVSGVTSANISGDSLTGNFQVISNTSAKAFNIAAEVTETSKTFTLALNNGEAITSVGILNQPIPTSANRTCIAVIDEVSRTATEIRNSWLAFKSSYPDRTFYLLQPGGPTRGDLKVPAEFTADPAAFGPIAVNRDDGTVSKASDWYTICNLSQLPDGSEIAMFIDTSGSMTMRTIQASYDLLVSKLNVRNMTIISVTNSQENWIEPFDQIL
jgi:hypothetical protein